MMLIKVKKIIVSGVAVATISVAVVAAASVGYLNLNISELDDANNCYTANVPADPSANPPILKVNGSKAALFFGAIGAPSELHNPDYVAPASASAHELELETFVETGINNTLNDSGCTS